LAGVTGGTGFAAGAVIVVLSAFVCPAKGFTWKYHVANPNAINSATISRFKALSVERNVSSKFLGRLQRVS
jgi:hypothetical protein